MEYSPNQNTAPMGGRLKKAVCFITERLFSAGDEPVWPTKQIDVGKSDGEARNVQLVIEGLQDYKGDGI